MLWIAAGLIALLLLSIFIGRYPKPYWMPPATLLNDTLAQKLVINLRLPRILAALLLGASLAACGATLQMIFRNPLVEPGFLGISASVTAGNLPAEYQTVGRVTGAV